MSPEGPFKRHAEIRSGCFPPALLARADNLIE